MITETKLKTFQRMNKQSDVMGVIRTLNTNIEVKITTAGFVTGVKS